MGSSSFFTKFASIDPVAQALHLPGYNKYAQQQASNAAGTSAANGGPYTGVAPTLAGANAGYAPGGPGSNVGWHPWVAPTQGGLFGNLQRLAGAGSTIINPAGAAGNSFVNPVTNPVSNKAQGAG